METSLFQSWHTGDGSTARELATSPLPSYAGNPGAITVFIADHQAMFRDGLRSLLELHHEFRVVGQAGDGEEAIRLVNELKPDVLLLDLAVLRVSGIDVLRELSRSSAPLRKIILAADVEPAELVRAVESGAEGVVLKGSTSQMLIECIRTVMAGGYWMEHQHVSTLVEALRSLSSSRAPKNRFGLSARELEVVRNVLASYGNKEIAAKLSISEHTVKNHLTNIFDKLGVSDRLELALMAVEHRLIDIL